MSRERELGKDLMYVGVGQTTSRLISFLLVPLYTSILTTEEFGIGDNIQQIALFLYPIFSLCIYEAVVRFVVGKHETAAHTFTLGLLLCVGGALVFTAMSPVMLLTDFGHAHYGWILAFVISSIFYQLFTQFARGIGKVRVFAASGVVFTIGMVAFNVGFLVVFKMGLRGYMGAIVLSNVVAAMYAFFAGKAYNYISFRGLSMRHLREMLSFSMPLVPGTLGWWMNNSAGRLIVTKFAGVAAEGLYAAANKIPYVMNMVSMIFNQAWQLSAIKEYESEDAKAYFSKVFNLYSAVVLVSVGVVIMCIEPLAVVLYRSDEFMEAWRYVPLIMISAMLGALQSYVASAMRAFNKTKMLLSTMGVSAVVNVVLCFVLVPRLGIWGAVIASVVAYAIILYMSLLLFGRVMKLEYSRLRLIGSILLLVAMSLLAMHDKAYSLPVAGVILAGVVMLYRAEVLTLWRIALKAVGSVVKKQHG